MDAISVSSSLKGAQVTTYTTMSKALDAWAQYYGCTNQTVRQVSALLNDAPWCRLPTPDVARRASNAVLEYSGAGESRSAALIAQLEAIR